MRSFILLTTFFMGCTCAWAQNDWVEYTKQQGIVFSVKDFTCDFGGGIPVEYKVLKIENPTGQRVHITYRIATYYANHPETGEYSPEYAGDLILGAGESFSGNCMGTAPTRLEILVRNPNLPNPPAFSHFAINAITIDQIE